MPGPLSSATTTSRAAAGTPCIEMVPVKTARPPASIHPDVFEAHASGLDHSLDMALQTHALISEPKVLGALAGLKERVLRGEADLNNAVTSGRFEGFPPIAVAARVANVNLVNAFLEFPSVNPYARDTRSQQGFPYQTVLMHAVRGAIEHKSTAALKRLLADPRVLLSINDDVIAADAPTEHYRALDFALGAHQVGHPGARKVVNLLTQARAKASYYIMPPENSEWYKQLLAD